MDLYDFLLIYMIFQWICQTGRAKWARPKFGGPLAAAHRRPLGGASAAARQVGGMPRLKQSQAPFKGANRKIYDLIRFNRI